MIIYAYKLYYTLKLQPGQENFENKLLQNNQFNLLLLLFL